MFSGALRAHIPSSRHAHTVLLADTVVLSPYWFQWTMFHILKFFPSVSDSLDIKGALPPVAGISLCPPVSSDGIDAHTPTADESIYYLTQSRTNMSCTVFFPSHFRVLQAFFAAQSSDGQRRTLPIPAELGHLRTHKQASAFDAHDILLPIYMRGYLFLVLNESISEVPAMYEPIFENGADSNDESEHLHSFISMPLYDTLSIYTKSLKSRTRVGDDFLEDDEFTSTLDRISGAVSWEAISVHPDLLATSSTPAPFSYKSARVRGKNFAKTIVPNCNIELSLSADGPRRAQINKDEDADIWDKMYGDNDYVELEGIAADDDWSDIFCLDSESGLEDDTSSGEFNDKNAKEAYSKSTPIRAKSLEEERRGTKRGRVVDAAVEGRPVKAKTIKSPSRTSVSESKGKR